MAGTLFEMRFINALSENELTNVYTISDDWCINASGSEISNVILALLFSRVDDKHVIPKVHRILGYRLISLLHDLCNIRKNGWITEANSILSDGHGKTQEAPISTNDIGVQTLMMPTIHSSSSGDMRPLDNGEDSGFHDFPTILLQSLTEGFTPRESLANHISQPQDGYVSLLPQPVECLKEHSAASSMKKSLLTVHQHANFSSSTPCTSDIDNLEADYQTIQPDFSLNNGQSTSSLTKQMPLNCPINTHSNEFADGVRSSQPLKMVQSGSSISPNLSSPPQDSLEQLNALSSADRILPDRTQNQRFSRQHHTDGSIKDFGRQQRLHNRLMHRKDAEETIHTISTLQRIRKRDSICQPSNIHNFETPQVREHSISQLSKDNSTSCSVTLSTESFSDAQERRNILTRVPMDFTCLQDNFPMQTMRLNTTMPTPGPDFLHDIDDNSYSFRSNTTILVYPKKNSKVNNNVLQLLENYINLLDENITLRKIRRIKMGGFALDCSNTTDYYRLSTLLLENSHISSQIDVKFPGNCFPQLIIYDIDDDSITYLPLLQRLVSHLDAKTDVFKIKKTITNHQGKKHLIIEVRSRLTYHYLVTQKFLQLGWKRKRLQPFIGIIRCSNCQRYGHTKRVCPDQFPTCVTCAQNHSSSSCPHTITACANCFVHFQNGYHIQYSHPANSTSCPCLIHYQQLRSKHYNW